jgi:hypothetical protein
MPRTEIETLVYSLDMDIRKMLKAQEKALKAANDNADGIHRKYKKATEGIGSALDSIFDNTRLKVMDSGVARVGLFGSSLEKLGAVGLTAAGAIGAFAVVMHQAQEAVNFADELDDLSARLGINVEKLQELHYAFGQTGIKAQEGDQALQGLNQTLGQLQAGLAGGKVKKAWEALGFDQKGLMQFHDASDLLPILADRIRGAGSAAEQAAIAKRLGIEPLLPLLRQGTDGMEALTQKARDLGIVMSAALVKQGADAADKLKELDAIMRAKTNIAFVEFADTLVTIKKLFLDATTAGLRFLAALTNTVPTTQKIVDLQKQIANQEKQIAFRQRVGGVFGGNMDAQRAALAQSREQLRELNRQAMREKAAAPSTPPAVEGAGGAARGLVTATGKARSKASKAFPSSAIELIHPPGFEDRSFNADLANIDEKLTERIQASVTEGISKGMLEKDSEAFSRYTGELHDATRQGVLAGMEALRSAGVAGLIDFFVQNLANKLETSLADALTNALLGSNGLGGNLFGTIFSSILGVPGFANGVDGMIGGRGGRDNNLLVAKVSRGERLTITPPGQSRGAAGGGVAISVAVEPSDLFDVHVSQISQSHAVAAGAASYIQASRDIPKQMVRRAGRRLG